MICKTSIRLLALVLVPLSLSCSDDDNDPQTIEENPALKVTAMASVIDEGNGINGVDDIIEYTISIHNTGDVTLSNMSLTSSLNDFLDNSLSLDTAPNFVNATLGSTIGSIQADEIATYAANFTITQSEVDADGLHYSVTVNATTPQNISVSDVSDNGDDLDGNLENDPTETDIEFDPLIISEYHVFNPFGTLTHKYIFDTNGRIAEMINLFDTNNNYTYNFASENKLINITKSDAGNTPLESIDINYNSENKIQSIGNRTYSYNPDITNYVPLNGYTLPNNPINFYIEDTSYYVSEEPTVDYEQEIIFAYFIEDINGQVSYSCDPFFIYRTFSDEISESCYGADVWSINNNLLLTTGDVEHNQNYEFDVLTNPIYQGLTNIANIAPFLNDNPLLLTNHLVFNKHFLSIHKQTRIGYNAESSEHAEFYYELNELDLPINSTAQSYYLGILDNEFINGNYYYQGDIIPD